MAQPDDFSSERISPPRARGARWLALFILGFPVLLFTLAGVRAVQLARQGEVPAELRDLDCDGRVGVVEWLRGGIDFRLRSSALHPGCAEIYAAKTGVTLVLRCPKPPICRLARDLPHR